MGRYTIFGGLLLLFILGHSSVIAQGDSEILLTAEEQEWLEEHKSVIIGVDPQFLPYDGVDENGEYIGIGADYLALIEERVAIQFELAPGLTWSEVIAGAQDSSIDLLPVVADTPERRTFLDFTSPYVSFQDVIFTRDDNNDIKNIEDLTDRKVAVVEAYATYGIISELNPTIEPYFVGSELEGLKAISLGEAEAYVGFLATNIHIAKKNGVNNIKIVGDIEGSEGEFKMGARKEMPELVSILNKALASISEEEKEEILNKWIAIEVDETINYRLFFTITIIAAVIILGIFFWNRSLQEQIRRRTIVEEKLRASEEKHRTIIEGLKGYFIYSQDPKGMFTYVSPSVKEILGYSEEEFMKTFLKNLTNNVINKKATLYNQKSRQGKEQESYEIEVYNKEKEKRRLEIREVPLLDTYGAVTAVQGIVHDITESRKAAEELKQSKAALEKTVKELQQFTNLTVDRELKMINLKKKMKQKKK